MTEASGFDRLNGTIVTASEDGSKLLPYRDADVADITVNGEINKLASNIGQARDFAGIHWRSDYEWGLQLGEAVAISVLRDQRKGIARKHIPDRGRPRARGFALVPDEGAVACIGPLKTGCGASSAKLPQRESGT